MDESLLDDTSVLRVAGRNANGVLDGIEEPQIHLAAVGSTGASGVEPLAMATLDGKTAFYPRCDAELVRALADRLREDRLMSTDAAAIVEHDPARPTFPVPPLSPLDIGERFILARCGWLRPTNRADYEAAGGFNALNRTDDAMDLSITGRGWGDIASNTTVTAVWDRLDHSTGDPAVIVNAHGSPTDRLLLESTPLTVIEGAIVVGNVIDASDIFIYVNEADTTAHDTAQAAATTAPTDRIHVETGPADYRAAEPTMAIEAIEGNHRLEARRRPPGPIEFGLHGRPTVIHTPRTLAAITAMLTDGAIPSRLFTVTGDVPAVTTLELPMDEHLATAVDAVGVDGSFQAASVGGKFGGLTADLDIAVRDLPSADLGPEGIVEVLNDDRCIVEFVGSRARFAELENCGRCVPCREGSKQLTNLLRSVYEGDFRPEAIDELIRVMASTSICQFGVDAPRPVRSALDRFETDFVAHANGTCPAGACDTTDQPVEVAP